MSESKGSFLAKSVQKHAGRAKEKILQNLGKVDRTADDIFDEHLQNFTRQQNAATKLQKEFSNYVRCVRALQTASRSLMESIGEIYESQWSGHDALFIQTQSVDILWQDFSHKLGDQVMIPLNTYQSQFGEMRKKIDKRGRKLVDYDGQRHNFQSLQLSMSKKRDDAKLSKGREQLEEAKRTYNMLNSELHDELPALYDSRILFLVTNLQSLFSSQQVFHAENSKVFAELEAIVDKLATDSQRGSYSIKKSNGSTLPKSPSNITSTIVNNVAPPTNNVGVSPEELASPTKIPEREKLVTRRSLESESVPETNAPPHSNSPTPLTSEMSINSTPTNNSHEAIAVESINSVTNEIVVPTINNSTENEKSSITENEKSGTEKEKSGTIEKEKESTQNEKSGTTENEKPQKQVEELYDIPVGASTDNLPPGVLYRVKATYKYNREDVDELSFDVDEIIQVIEYEDPEEQEEGWLMGYKEHDGEKGMFPANFTKPL